MISNHVMYMQNILFINSYQKAQSNEELYAAPDYHIILLTYNHSYMNI